MPAEIIDRTPGGMPNGPLRPLDGENTLPDEPSAAIVDEAAIAGSPTGMPPESKSGTFPPAWPGPFRRGDHVMKYVLHIGPNKTGTTSLQHAFNDNREALRGRGVEYPGPAWGHIGQHKFAKFSRGDDPEEIDLPGNWMERFRAETEGSGAETCVVSSEIFFHDSDPEKVATLFPPGRTRIAIYLREPVSHSVSWYQQWVVNLDVSMSLLEFVDVETSPLFFSDTVRKWSDSFGRENVELRAYDRDALLNGNVVADFANLIQPGLEEMFSGQNHVYNPSIAGNLLFVKRMLNCFIDSKESRSVKLEMDELSKLDPSFIGRIPVDQAMVNKIASLRGRDIKALEENFGLRLEPRDKPFEAPAWPDQDRLAEDFARIFAEARAKEYKIVPLLERMTSMFGGA